MGAVGPHARASGVKIDVRRDAPYSSYEDFDFDVPTVDSGDVFARVVVRALECYESIKIIQQALEKQGNPNGTWMNIKGERDAVHSSERMVGHERQPRLRGIGKVFKSLDLNLYV